MAALGLNLVLALLAASTLVQAGPISGSTMVTEKPKKAEKSHCQSLKLSTNVCATMFEKTGELMYRVSNKKFPYSHCISNVHKAVAISSAIWHFEKTFGI